MLVTYIDIHTHQPGPDRTGVLSVRNIRFLNSADDGNTAVWFSIGLHPWDTKSITPDIEKINRIASLSECLAIGECGLDKLRGAGIPEQSELFRKQAQIAETRGKPLIIHCVRALQELMAIKKDINPQVPWIIHGFSGKPEQARQLTNSGFMLSFGAAILHPGKPVRSSLAKVPNNSFFLETDDSGLMVEEIYRAAAEIKNVSLEELQYLLLGNFESVYGKPGTSGMAATH